MTTEGTTGAVEVAGKLTFSDRALMQLALEAVTGVEGVAGLHGSFFPDLVEFVRTGERIKGLRVTRKKNAIILDVDFDVVYGANIPEVARKLQERITEVIQRYAGLEEVVVQARAATIR